MSRISCALASVVLLASLTLACGDKQNPLGPAPSTGGSTDTGGTQVTGGSSGTGGQATGGSSGTGGQTTGGSSGTGGQLTGGSSGTGGQATGGSSGTGGQATGGSSGTGGTTSASVSFSTSILPLMKKSCSCHLAGTAPALDTYANVKVSAPAANAAIKSGNMPLGTTLTAAEKALFQAWIDEGTPNN